jgi:hypothetical protein
MAKSSRPTSTSGSSRSSSEGGFENPSGNQGSDQQDTGREEEDQTFEAPSAGELGSAITDSETAAIEAELDEDIVSLKGEIEKKLASDVKATAAGASVQDLEGSNIGGVGIGYGEPEAGGGEVTAPPGQLSLVVFTIEQREHSQVMSEISSVAGTRALSEVPIVQVPVGVVDALTHRFRIRPAPGGVSVGHFAITAGTLGCLCVGLHAPRTNRLMVLSNNHVLANSNAAHLGDCICQPGPYDGGKCPQDQIAILERFVPINFAGGINYVDCATGWAWPDRVRRELVYLSGGTLHYFRIGAAPIAPAVGMLVGKTGRTTQLKSGRITAIGVAVNVNYGGGRVAHFRDQIAIRGTAGDFSAGGDSGSAVWQWAAGLRAVGLLYAGGGGTTFANRITRVLSGLDIRLYT